MQESSDSESEIEPSVYEKRRELNAWRTVLAEKLFTEAKKKLYAEKLKQVIFEGFFACRFSNMEFV